MDYDVRPAIPARRKAMDRKELMDFFNHRPRNCLLITSNDEGKVNVAVYGSPAMIDENTVVQMPLGHSGRVKFECRQKSAGL
jgi:hypothetical protein